jgi:hypothetical protein
VSGEWWALGTGRHFEALPGRMESLALTPSREQQVVTAKWVAERVGVGQALGQGAQLIRWLRGPLPHCVIA